MVERLVVLLGVPAIPLLVESAHVHFGHVHRRIGEVDRAHPHFVLVWVQPEHKPRRACWDKHVVCRNVFAVEEIVNPGMAPAVAVAVAVAVARVPFETKGVELSVHEVPVRVLATWLMICLATNERTNERTNDRSQSEKKSQMEWQCQTPQSGNKVTAHTPTQMPRQRQRQRQGKVSANLPAADALTHRFDSAGPVPPLVAYCHVNESKKQKVKSQSQQQRINGS